MPLRDHFRPPLDDTRSWDELHGAWPTVMVMALNRKLPPRYVAAPGVHLGGYFEVDVASFDRDEIDAVEQGEAEGEGGVATAVWAPPRPTLDIAAQLPGQDEYEVRIYDRRHDRRLVAAVEIVSPSNKDRPNRRRAFVAKCGALLKEQVSVALVDVVTTREPNLYGELLDLIGQSDPELPPQPPAIYAAACHWVNDGNDWRFRAWAHTLAIGQPLPTLPLWLSETFAVPLELEATYEETCRVLRMP